ncbi:MAG: flavin reductase family protein [archaeon]
MKIINPQELRLGVIPGPKPVTLVTCGTYEEPNIITISYVGQLSDRLMYIGIRPSRHSNKLISEQRKFGINYMGADYVKETDYCGLVSGRDVNKFEVTKFTKQKGITGVPLIKESPLSVECELTEILELGDHDLFIGEVKSIVKNEGETDWLFHDYFEYFGKQGVVGRLFECGKNLRISNG